MICFFFQAEDGIRDLVRSRGLGDVYKRQGEPTTDIPNWHEESTDIPPMGDVDRRRAWNRALSPAPAAPCLLYTSDAADERSSVDLGGRRIIKKKKQEIKEEVQEELYSQRTNIYKSVHNKRVLDYNNEDTDQILNTRRI